MATYGKLQARFTQLKNQEQQYWTDLQEVLRELKNKVSTLLGLSKDTESNLRLGHKNEEGEFQEALPGDLRQKFRHLEFSFELVLSNEECNIPPSKLLTAWKIEGGDDGYILYSSTGKEELKSYDQGALFIINGFSKALDAFDPSKKKNLF